MIWKPGDTHPYTGEIVARLGYTPQDGPPILDALVGIVAGDKFEEPAGVDGIVLSTSKVAIIKLPVDIFANSSPGRQPLILDMMSGLQVYENRKVLFETNPTHEEGARLEFARFIGDTSMHTRTQACFLRWRAVMAALSSFPQHVQASAQGEVVPLRSFVEVYPSFITAAYAGLLLPVTK